MNRAKCSDCVIGFSLGIYDMVYASNPCPPDALDEVFNFCPHCGHSVEHIHCGVPAELLQSEPIPDDEAIHHWFSLTYAAYLVLPRLWLQNMPGIWQREFVALLEEIPKTLVIEDEHYIISTRRDGKFCQPKYSNYRRGTMEFKK